MNNNRLSFPNGFEKTEVRWEKIKIKLAPNVLRVYLVPNLKRKNMKEEQRKRMKQKFVDAGERSVLNKHAVSGRSEQCLHTERVWTIDPYDQKCFKCVKCGEYGV